MAIAKKIVIAVAAMIFVVVVVWCMDGLFCELRQIRKNKQ